MTRSDCDEEILELTAFPTLPLAGRGAHVALDIDVLDPSEAPGTGFPEAGGIRMRDLQVLLRSLTGKHVASVDICEINPMLDPTRTTMVNTLNALFELVCIAAAGRES